MFNALRYSQDLEKAGFTREQAEASVRLLIDTMNENLASKSDLKELDGNLRGFIQEVRAELKAEIRSVKAELKTEIQELRSELKTEIQELRSELRSETQSLRSEIKEVEYRLTIRLGAMMTVAVGMVAALVRFFPGGH